MPLPFGSGRCSERGEQHLWYFTATGNSLYAARHFSDAPVSIPQIMRGTERQFADDAIGIVCPVYAGEPPKMVKQFLREIIEANGNQS